MFSSCASLLSTLFHLVGKLLLLVIDLVFTVLEPTPQCNSFLAQSIFGETASQHMISSLEAM